MTSQDSFKRSNSKKKKNSRRKKPKSSIVLIISICNDVDFRSEGLVVSESGLEKNGISFFDSCQDTPATKDICPNPDVLHDKKTKKKNAFSKLFGSKKVKQLKRNQNKKTKQVFEETQDTNTSTAATQLGDSASSIVAASASGSNESKPTTLLNKASSRNQYDAILASFRSSLNALTKERLIRF